MQLNLAVSVTALVAAYPSLSVIDQFGKRPIWRLRVAAGTSTDSVLTQLRADTTRVRFAESNAENETPEGRRRTVWLVGGDAGTFASQWAPASLRLPEAHTTSVGTGIRVAVLDTGIDLAHPALAGRPGPHRRRRGGRARLRRRRRRPERGGRRHRPRLRPRHACGGPGEPGGARRHADAGTRARPQRPRQRLGAGRGAGLGRRPRRQPGHRRRRACHQPEHRHHAADQPAAHRRRAGRL